MVATIEASIEEINSNVGNAADLEALEGLKKMFYAPVSLVVDDKDFNDL